MPHQVPIHRPGKTRHSILDVFYYIQGHLRYRLYYSPNSLIRLLMRKHIREQIDYRISIMLPECYDNGTCIKCGCMTTHLQMANKPCNGLEYPPMLTRPLWKAYMEGRYVVRRGIYGWIHKLGETRVFKETRLGFMQLNTSNISNY